MKWNLTLSPPVWYVVFWIAFQLAFWTSAMILGPEIIARGLALWSERRGTVIYGGDHG